MIFRDTIRKTGSLRAARFFLALAFFAGTCGARAQDWQPEADTGFAPRPGAVGASFMVVTANVHASDAANEILQLGGNALDAAIAAQWVLNLVEPQSSGVGGGGFLLHWDQRRRRVSAWDGRETAPRRAQAGIAVDADGGALDFSRMLSSGKAVGVPGLVAMLEDAHRHYGKLKWERLFQPAIRLADNGFIISARLHRLLRDDPLLSRDVAARALYYHEDGSARAVGERLRNPALADTFRRLAQDGAAGFYSGSIAERMAAAAVERGGVLTAADMDDYRSRRREAVCGPYRQWRICGMPPPSSGGIGVIQLLGLLARAMPDPSARSGIDADHFFAEAGRLVHADRNRYLADPEFVSVPGRALLDTAYLDQRARLIDPAHSMGVAAPGEMSPDLPLADGDAPELPATTHVSIVDRSGNAVALTSSIESAFGSRIQVDGFLLNNQLTDFSLATAVEGKPAANRMEPGKRPLSSMAPTFVFDATGQLHVVLGSPGGGRIINYVARTLVAILDGRMAPEAAVAQAHLGNRNGATEVERGRYPEAWVQELQRRGHQVIRADMTSGLHMIVRGAGGWTGVVDPRREGVARGG